MAEQYGYSPETRVEWNEETTSNVIRLYRLGYSYSNIAKMLKITRSQVSGKLSRLVKNKTIESRFSNGSKLIKKLP